MPLTLKRTRTPGWSMTFDVTDSTRGETARHFAAAVDGIPGATWGASYGRYSHAVTVRAAHLPQFARVLWRLWRRRGE